MCDDADILKHEPVPLVSISVVPVCLSVRHSQKQRSALRVLYYLIIGENFSPMRIFVFSIGENFSPIWFDWGKLFPSKYLLGKTFPQYRNWWCQNNNHQNRQEPSYCCITAGHEATRGDRWCVCKRPCMHRPNDILLAVRTYRDLLRLLTCVSPDSILKQLAFTARLLHAGFVVVGGKSCFTS